MNRSDPHIHPTDVEHLHAEIRRYEAHLAEIAGHDDSAYEKARIRVCEALLQEYRRRLHTLTAHC
jgi:hypothetical protein